MSEHQPPAAPQPSGEPTTPPTTPQPSPSPAPSGQAPPGDPRAQHADPPPARGLHVGAIIAIVVGGLVLLGATFAGGAAAGWWFGAHQGAGWSQHGPAYPGGPYGPDHPDRQQPGQRDGNDEPNS
jgi:hypothetical protein